MKIDKYSLIDIMINDDNIKNYLYLVKNCNYLLYSKYELDNLENYELALLFKDLANFSEEIFFNIINNGYYNLNYLYSKMHDFMFRLNLLIKASK